MKGGLGDMMKKAQEMQENMQKAQQELAATCSSNHAWHP
jgi:DNA-binding protein YbaB